MLDSLYPPQPSGVIVDIAPVYSALSSLVSVADARKSPGISAWSVRTRDALSQEEWEKHHLLASWIGIEALSNSIETVEAFASFPAFVQALADRPATSLRDALLSWMVASPSSRLVHKPPHPQVDDPLSLLDSEPSFFTFYDARNKSEKEIDILRRLYQTMLDPPGLQSLLTGYLEHFWRTHFKEEWERILPELEEAVTGFEQIDATGMSHFEVIETITRRNLRGVYRADVLAGYATLRFIPSFHCGPYILRFSDGQELRIIFGAHHLLDLARGRQDVDRGYLVERMKALGDETRLEIVQALKEHGELGTQEIIGQLNLSRSAASRHLRQLYANNIVDMRMDEDGLKKYYRLDPGFKREMYSVLDRLLG